MRDHPQINGLVCHVTVQTRQHLLQFVSAAQHWCVDCWGYHGCLFTWFVMSFVFYPGYLHNFYWSECIIDILLLTIYISYCFNYRYNIFVLVGSFSHGSLVPLQQTYGEQYVWNIGSQCNHSIESQYLSSAFGKYSDPLTFSTFCYSLILKLI